MNKTNTRKFKAKELLARVKAGPSWSIFSEGKKHNSEFQTQYRLWSSSWLVPAIEELLKKELE